MGNYNSFIPDCKPHGNCKGSSRSCLWHFPIHISICSSPCGDPGMMMFHCFASFVASLPTHSCSASSADWSGRTQEHKKQSLCLSLLCPVCVAEGMFCMVSTWLPKWSLWMTEMWVFISSPILSPDKQVSCNTHKVWSNVAGAVTQVYRMTLPYSSF